MINGQMIQSHVRRYLDGKISLDEFEDWFLSNSWNAHLDSPEDAVDAAQKIEGTLLDYSSGAIAVASLMSGLAAAIRPFEHPLAVLNSRNTNWVSNSNDSALSFPVASANNNLGFNEAYAA